MKKKILFCINDLGFLLSHRSEIILATKNAGYEVLIAYGQAGKVDWDFIKHNNLKVKNIYMRKGSKKLFTEMICFLHLLLIVKKFKPDIMHLVTVKAYLYGGIIARILSVPAVVTAIAGLGILRPDQSLKQRFFWSIFKRTFAFAMHHKNQIIIVQNSSDQKFLKERDIVTNDRFVLIKGSGVDLSKMLYEPEAEEPVKITFCARLLKSKGIYDFIKASQILKARNYDVDFLVAGEVDEESPDSLIANEIDQLSGSTSVQFLGFVDNVNELYVKSHIICLPSYYGEGLPKSLIEAAALGRTIVTTNCPGCADTVIPGQTGFLVPPKDPEALAAKLQWLIDNPLQRKNMGKSAQEFALKTFCVTKVVEKHLDIYEKLVTTT